MYPTPTADGPGLWFIGSPAGGAAGCDVEFLCRELFWDPDGVEDSWLRPREGSYHKEELGVDRCWQALPVIALYFYIHTPVTHEYI